MYKIHQYIEKFKKYLAYSLDIQKYYLEKIKHLVHYEDFEKKMTTHYDILKEIHTYMSQLTPFQLSFSKITEIGNIMCIFYKIYDNASYHDAMLYSFGFNGYLDMTCVLKGYISDKKMSRATFNKDNINNKQKESKDKKDNKGTKNNSSTYLRDMYYPKSLDDPEHVVTNDCDLSKNIVITGPNASGKTTTLKTVVINLLLSQQTGFGCYKRLTFTPYGDFHCYLNIPDTSGRDSLFQAEARRCKDILDIIHKDIDKRHFCIFDELYSGTNPEEAVVSALALINYMVKNKNISCMLSTHYVKLCKKLIKNERVKNYHMKTIVGEDSGLTYKYKLVKGISSIKGGLKVLKDMKYPEEILESIQG